MTTLRSIWERALDLLYPSVCVGCGVMLRRGSNICPSCWHELPRVSPPFCRRCSEGFDGNIAGGFECQQCRDTSYDFAFARSTLLNHPQTRSLIHDFKYRRAVHLARDIASLMAETFEHDQRLQLAREQGWVLVPVPLHHRRQSQRHYNQCEEIARHLAPMLGLRLCLALKRVRATPTQTRLSRQQRLRNLTGSMRLTRRGSIQLARGAVAGWILVDDVYTTGSTVQECAKVLRRAGAENIVVVTALRG